MRNLFYILPLLALCACKTPSPLTSPAAVTADVADGLRIGLDLYPEAALDIAIARDVVCRAATQTNVSPNALIADFNAAGITNKNSKAAIDIGLFVWDRVYPLIGTNVQVYGMALCAGFTQALSVGPTGRRHHGTIPPHLQ